MVRERDKGRDPDERINLKLKAPAEQCRDGGSNVNYPGASGCCGTHEACFMVPAKTPIEFSTVVQVWGTQKPRLVTPAECLSLIIV